MDNLPDILSHAWNIFATSSNRFYPIQGRSYASDPERPRFSGGNEQSFISSLYNRISIDISMLNIEHCRINDDGQYVESMSSRLNNCLTISSNIDQIPSAFFQDLVTTMFDRGVAAAVPTIFDIDPSSKTPGAFDVLSMRVGVVKGWHPTYVDVEVYNENVGERQTIQVPKNVCAIIQNPLYSIMNEPNSTLQRLIRKLNLLDVIDEQSGSGKMNMIIQFPYTIRSDARKAEAEKKIKQIEDQLENSKYGVAYADGQDRITQLNRAMDNNLLDQVKYLTDLVYSQLGISDNVMNGKASADEELNYYNKTVDPIATTICKSFKRTFLTSTAITQGQTITYFRDPFRLIAVDKIADMADKFTRNEIMSSNEFRGKLGLRRSNDPSADELRNKNLNKSESGSDSSGLPRDSEQPQIESNNGDSEETTPQNT